MSCRTPPGRHPTDRSQMHSRRPRFWAGLLGGSGSQSLSSLSVRTANLLPLTNGTSLSLETLLLPLLERCETCMTSTTSLSSSTCVAPVGCILGITSLPTIGLEMCRRVVRDATPRQLSPHANRIATQHPPHHVQNSRNHRRWHSSCWLHTPGNN